MVTIGYSQWLWPPVLWLELGDLLLYVLPRTRDAVLFFCHGWFMASNCLGWLEFFMLGVCVKETSTEVSMTKFFSSFYTWISETSMLVSFSLFWLLSWIDIAAMFAMFKSYFAARGIAGIWMFDGTGSLPRNGMSKALAFLTDLCLTTPGCTKGYIRLHGGFKRGT